MQKERGRGEREREMLSVFFSVSLWVSARRPKGVIPPGSLSPVCHTGLLEPGRVAYLHAQSHLSKSDTLCDRVIHSAISPPRMCLVFGVALPLARSERGPSGRGETEAFGDKEVRGFEVFGGQRSSVKQSVR